MRISDWSSDVCSSDLSGRGQPYLREWLANWMNEEGCALTADHILITNGAKQGIDLVCRLLLDEGDAIVVTAPTYFTAIPIFRNYGAEFVEIEQDDAGLDVAALEAALDARSDRKSTRLNSSH